MTDPVEQPRADLDVVRSWLQIIYPPGSIMHISAKGQWAGRRFTNDPGGLSAAVEYVRQLDAQRVEGVYARMQPLKADTPSGGRGRAVDAAALPCLWADIDIAGPGHVETNLPGSVEEAMSTIRHLPEPSYVVNSGGGIYPIWMLNTPLPLLDEELHSTAAKLSEEWNQLVADGHAEHGFKYGTGVHDLARVLRIPGTVNRKAGLARATSVQNGGGKFTASQLLDTVKKLRKSPQAIVSQQPQLEVTSHAPSYNAGESERPGDVYNRDASWEDALGPEFIKIRDCNDGSAEWAWADDPHHDVKLTTDRDGMHNAFFFTTSWSLAPQEPHSKFYVYAHRVHAGDLASATKDVAQRFGLHGDRDAADAFFDQYPVANRAASTSRSNGTLMQGMVGNDVDSVQGDVALDLTLDAHFLSVDDLAALEPPVPIIDDILMRHSVGILNGRGGSYKSFLALDWALCMATGKSWQGKRVERMKVDYVAGEGAHGLKKRIDAWRASWPTETDLSWFRVLPFAPNFLRDPTRTAALIRSVESNGTGLVVIDTLRRISGGADENGTKDMGPIWDRLTTLRQSTNRGSVLVVAHTPKDGRETTRGASSIEDDSDTIWHVKKDGKAMTLSCLKMKDAEEPGEMHLSVREVPSAGGGKGSLVIESLSSSGAFVSAVESAVLAELADCTLATSPTELATLLGRDRAHVGKDLRKLVARGLVESTGNENRPKYGLTARGRAYLETGDLGSSVQNEQVQPSDVQSGYWEN